MYSISMSPFIFGTVMLVIIAATAAQSAEAEEAPAVEIPEVSCSVTDEQIVAATARQQVRLDTHRCTASVRTMVESTFTRVRKGYTAFYKQTHLNPAAAADVSLLLVRRQLLSGSWSADTAERYTVSKDPVLLNEIEERLHEYLTPQQVSSLKAYEKTIPARTLVEPVVSRLEEQGRPVSELQYEEALGRVQRFFAEWMKNIPAQTPTMDSREWCIDANADANARMNRLDERIREIFWRLLDEDQQDIAGAYYRDLFERRGRMLQLYESKLATEGDATCTYPAL